MTSNADKLNRRQTFYLIVITQTLSLVGSRMTSIGIGLWLFNQTGATTPLLLTAFFNELPGMLGSSVAGVLVDRWPRRRVLLLADLGQAVGTLLLLILFLAGAFQVWHLYLIALLQGTFAILQQPALDATTTLLVTEAQRERANAIQQMGFPLAGVFAPVLAGLVYAWSGLSGVIMVDLATFFIALSAIYLSTIPQPPPTLEGQAAQGNFWRELAGGFGYLAHRPSLLGLVLYITVMNFLLNGSLDLTLPYLVQITHSETLVGGLMGLMSLGALTGAGLMSVWPGTRPRMYTLLAGYLLTGLMFLFYGTARSPLGLGLSLFVLMIPLPIGNALLISILQLKTPPDMQGRIFATMSQLGYLGATASFLSVGPLVDRVLEPAVDQPSWGIIAPLVGAQAGSGIGLLLAGSGVLILLITLAVSFWPQFRRLELILPDYALSDSVSS